MSNGIMSLLINGSEVHTDNKLIVKSPWSREQVGECSYAGEKEVRLAIESGCEGAHRMRELRNYQRAEILHKAADLIAEQSEDLARTITLEGGKHREDDAGLVVLQQSVGGIDAAVVALES